VVAGGSRGRSAGLLLAVVGYRRERTGFHHRFERTVVDVEREIDPSPLADRLVATEEDFGGVEPDPAGEL